MQQDIHGHRGRKNDPLYGIRTILRCGQENLTDRQQARLGKAINADERHEEVYIAWQCAQRLRAAYRADNPVEVRRIARGFRNRDNYHLRTLLIGGGLTHPHLKQEEPVMAIGRRPWRARPRCLSPGRGLHARRRGSGRATSRGLCRRAGQRSRLG